MRILHWACGVAFCKKKPKDGDFISISACAEARKIFAQVTRHILHQMPGNLPQIFRLAKSRFLHTELERKDRKEDCFLRRRLRGEKKS